MAKTFRKYGCPLYGKLCIYGDNTTTRSNARASTHSPIDSEENVRDPPMQEEDKSQPLSDEDDIFYDISNISQGHVRPNYTPSTSTKI